ncbi:ABC transporter permease [Thiothrix subterranea]|uniref:Transport permease protein n=1 Tax=Thiothrix subterranea TaxID=2735563 RepID=A0AA51MPN4_9GAMM|nr:ABC transporter permease [Thiothrix subterranea]MDQ5768378.1 ABC transporter permease [Thiothrix subterranea]WML86966.1 ABC transporter permease [Thiothrix subterranea]
MQLYQPLPLSPLAMLGSVWRNRQLIWQMSKRDVLGRYRGSMIGMAWSFFNPLFMLAVYTFVFSVVFESRWGVDTGESRGSFAVILFAGLVVHGLLAECVNRAPGLILSNANYVKKVVFPLEILPWVTLVSALFHTGISLLVLLIAELLLMQHVPWTVLLLPLVWLPFVMGIMGISWFLAALGVYVRDVAQITGLLTTVLLFMSPVFYPLSRLPEHFQTVLLLNPLTFMIEQTRQLVIWGNAPDWGGLLLYSAVACLVAWLGFVWFQKTRGGFADVL